MRPLRPACGTVSKAQLLTLPEIIRIMAPGVVTTQLSSLPPASSNATDVLGSSDSRLATAQPPEPPPTTTKSNVSVICVSPEILLFTCVIPGCSKGPDPEVRACLTHRDLLRCAIAHQGSRWRAPRNDITT